MTAALAACGQAAYRTPNPVGYPVECSGDSCFQLGRPVALIHHGRFVLAAERDCKTRGPKDFWQNIADPAPGAGPAADTYMCGTVGINLVIP